MVEQLRDMLLSEEGMDFDALLSLIKEVEHSHSNDIEAIDQVYEKLLSKFPLCYAFWVKYAQHKLRLCGPNEALQVYERAVQAVTFSIDLWSHYCTFGAITFEDLHDVRRLFERALSLVGKDYLCHRIWDKWIEFEYAHKQWNQLANIYINILKFPTKKLHEYYESFKKLVSLLEEEASIQDMELISQSASTSNQDGESMKDLEDSDIVNAAVQGFMDADDHKVSIDMIKKYMWVGEELYKRSCQIEKNILCYEDNITRHYFHVKPLGHSELENWHQYLNFVETRGDFDWMLKLYERCLIPCANYPEFWIRYMDFVDEHGGKEIANYALNRSPPFFQKVPSYRMYCAMMEDLGASLSAPLLHDFSHFSSNYIEDIYRKANFQKRKGNVKGAFNLYESEIESAVEKQHTEVASSLYVNFAQFTFAATGSRDAAREIFLKGIRQIPCTSLIKMFIQFEMINGGVSQIPFVDSIISDVIRPKTDGSAPLCDKEREEISMLYFDFVDLYGEPSQIRKAWARHCILFPMESRNAFPLTESTSHKRAEPAEREEHKHDESSVGVIQCAESKANPETIDCKCDAQIPPKLGTDLGRSKDSELGEDVAISDAYLGRSEKLMQETSEYKASSSSGASLDGVLASQTWQQYNHNQHQLQQMYYFLQIQQQQLQQQQNQLQSSLSSSSPNNSLHQQQLQQQVMYYHQMYQMYLQQTTQLQQQQQQQQQMAMANAPYSQQMVSGQLATSQQSGQENQGDKKSGSSRSSTPIK